MLRKRIENEMGMDIPFQEEIRSGYEVAKAAHIHSQKCKKNRESRHKKFDKVRVLYWNLIFFSIVSVGRLVYEIIQILKM